MWFYITLLRLRFLFWTQMLCPLGIHHRRATGFQNRLDIPYASGCVFCGAK